MHELYDNGTSSASANSFELNFLGSLNETFSIAKALRSSWQIFLQWKFNLITNLLVHSRGEVKALISHKKHKNSTFFKIQVNHSNARKSFNHTQIVCFISFIHFKSSSRAKTQPLFHSFDNAVSLKLKVNLYSITFNNISFNYHN